MATSTTGGAEAARFAARWLPSVDAALTRAVAEETGPGHVLFGPATYWLERKGRRIRPLALLAASELVGGQPSAAIEGACAVECIHTASLILDDLPCMDGGMRRRGADTLHRVYGEATAVLTALLFLNLAHRRLASTTYPSARGMHARICHLLGGDGMILGQAVDLLADRADTTMDAEELREARIKKTTSLMVGALELGASLGGASAEAIDSLGRFGAGLGRLLQAADDLVDADGGPLSRAETDRAWAAIADARQNALRSLCGAFETDGPGGQVLIGLVDMVAQGPGLRDR